MTRSVLRPLLAVLRYGLCVVALVFLYNAVTWHDRIVLADGTTRVRLIESRDDGFVVLRDGAEQLLARDQIRLVPPGDLPDIQYGLSTVLRRADFRAALWALLLFLPIPLIQSLRLVWMLAIQRVNLSYWNAVKLSFAGNFFNFALPGTTGGDLIKAYYITLYTHQKHEAVTTVFLDRVVGLLGVITVASLSLLYAGARVPWDPTTARMVSTALPAIWLGLAVAGVFVLAPRLRQALRLRALAARLPAGEHLLRIGGAVVALGRRWPIFVAACLNTVVLQFLLVCCALQMARALHMRGDAELYFICIPAGFLIAAIPISPPQAIGVLEWAYIQFFTTGGLNDASQALALALAIRLIQLFWALPGVLVPLLGAHLPDRKALQTLEQDAGPATPETG